MTRATRRRLAAATFALPIVAVPPARLAAHPLHTTITELTEDRARGTVRAVIRVFADDFGTAAARHARGTRAPDSAAFAYASASFSFADRAGHFLPAQSCGVRRTGVLIWVCLESRAPAGLASLAVRNAVLCDLFDDQVNVVQGVVGGARRSLLFTRGDRAKPLG